jgi:hypothetical protein
MNILEKKMRKYKYKRVGVAATRVVGPIFV